MFGTSVGVSSVGEAGSAGDGGAGSDSSTSDGSDGGTMGDGDGDGDGGGDGDGDGDGDGGTTGEPATCGDGVVGGFEFCDCGPDGQCTPDELDGLDCTDVIEPVSGNPYSGGELDCNLSCQAVTTGCYVCGDGLKDPSEPCDGNQLGTSTCGTAGFLGGTIACTSDCSLDTSGCTAASFLEDWESGAIDATVWGSAGNTPWAIDGSIASSGSFSARSGDIGTNQTTELVLDMTWANPGTIAFAYRTSSESCCDELHFYIDDVEQGTGFGGETDWTDASYAVTAGAHRLRWEYEKDGSVDTGQDRVWIDDVRSDGVVTEPTCGDALLSSGEPCDGNLLGGQSCGTLGFLSGNLACSNCEFDTSACTMANFVEDWETGDFSGGPWVFAGTGNWLVDGTAANSGAFAAHSPALSANQNSELQLTLNFASAGVMNFDYKVSSESCCDELHFFIDGFEQGSGWGGEIDWTEASYAIGAGSHTFRWQYEKDGSVDSGQDRAWIDDIRSDGAP